MKSPTISHSGRGSWWITAVDYLDQVYPICYGYSPCHQPRVAALGSQGAGKYNEMYPLVSHRFSARWEMLSDMGLCSKATGTRGFRDPGPQDFWSSAQTTVVVASVHGPWPVLVGVVVPENGRRLRFWTDRSGPHCCSAKMKTKESLSWVGFGSRCLGPRRAGAADASGLDAIPGDPPDGAGHHVELGHQRSPRLEMEFIQHLLV
jgi:hypothetical protein